MLSLLALLGAPRANFAELDAGMISARTKAAPQRGTAKALGLDVPPMLLARADAVIE